jgi:hypothetical protein
MNRLLSCAVVAAAFAASVAGTGATGQNGRREGLQLFNERVAAYAELHHRVDAVFPPWKPSDDVESIFRRREYLAAAITAERPNASQGDVFESSAAAALRGVIAAALNGVDVELLLAALYEECELPANYRPRVNTGYPKWATHEMPFVLLAALPPLPDGILYRLIDHDLLLWDVDADVIIDVLPEALPRAGS